MAYRCPKRHDFKPEIHKEPDFKIRALETVTAYVNDQGEVYDLKGGDLEWDEASEMTCLNCGHVGEVGDFSPDEKGGN